MHQIHVWSDYVCPFCLIADVLIERATADRDDVEVVHHPHELRPNPVPTLRPEDPYLPQIWERAVYPMARRYDVPMRLPSVSPQPRTELAFRGARYAADQGVGAAYHRRVLTSFFEDDHDIGRRDVLADVAVEVGLDRAHYLAALEDPGLARRHARAREAAVGHITVVPTVVVGTRRIEGVASESVVRRALDATDVGGAA